jgi:hypothetical protein
MQPNLNSSNGVLNFYHHRTRWLMVGEASLISSSNDFIF